MAEFVLAQLPFDGVTMPLVLTLELPFLLLRLDRCCVLEVTEFALPLFVLCNDNGSVRVPFRRKGLLGGRLA